MIRNRPTVGDAEIRLKVVRNLGSQTLPRGSACYYAAPNDPGAGTGPKAISVDLPLDSSRIITLFAGLVYDDAGIPAGAFGQIQTSGDADYAQVSGDLFAQTEIGETLQGVVGAGTLTRASAFGGQPYTHVIAMEVVPVGASTAARSVLLRCPE